jgi:hypothetical protein
MKCATCVEQGKRSVVYPGLTAVTDMGWTPYYDEDGQYHNHNPNWHTTGFRCSEGHNWQRSSLKPCPNCLYGREDKYVTRDKSGTVVPQCEMQYVRSVNHVRCVKESGHDGEHTDARGEWNEKTETDSHDAG